MDVRQELPAPSCLHEGKACLETEPTPQKAGLRDANYVPTTRYGLRSLIQLTEGGNFVVTSQ